ncbi:MAG: hypothetical protein LBG80_15010 [Bacteroidales bacterium]|jgi:hypothetical protein|nr:hypothetical protein [Bacteroidales bacterium]
MSNITNKWTEIRQRNTQTLCFYGNKFLKENIENFLSESNLIASDYGLTFDRLSLMFKNGRKSRVSKYSLNHFQQKFDLEQFSIVSAFQFWEGGWKDDYIIYCSVDKDRALLTFADENINLPINESKQLLLKLSSLLHSCYSVYFEIPYDVSPYFFSLGIVAGDYYKYFLLNSPDNSAEKGLRFCRWGTGLNEKVYLRGVIRDVYQLNILCKVQAYFPFDGTPLIDCVRSGKVEGTIEEITPERFLWTVPKDNIPDTTEKCEKAGFLFNQLKDVPGDILWDDPDVAEYHKGDARREANGKVIKKFLDATMNNEKPDPNDFLNIFVQKD